MKIKNLIIIIVIISYVSLMLLSGYNKGINFNSIDEIVDFCKSEDIFKSSECVNRITNKFFKYNLDSVGKNISFERLKSNGGECEDWTLYHCEIGNKLGYITKFEDFLIQSVKINNKTEIENHVYCRWNDKTGYVIFDGENLHQQRFMERDFEKFILKEVYGEEP